MPQHVAKHPASVAFAKLNSDWLLVPIHDITPWLADSSSMTGIPRHHRRTRRHLQAHRLISRLSQLGCQRPVVRPTKMINPAVEKRR
jgi:hypothetical protein